jgi:hypothetical protein
MVILLKIFLFILVVGFGYMIWFIKKDFKRFSQTEESAEASLIQRLMLKTIVYGSYVLLTIFILFCLILFCSSIVISTSF